MRTHTITMGALNVLCLVVATAAAGVRALEEVTSVDLGTAGNFAILSKAGISTVPTSAITGDIGVSPIAAEAITGFSLIQTTDRSKSTSVQVTGSAYAADYASPTPSTLTTAIGDMERAYTDAAGRTVAAANLNVMNGLITGATLTAGVYEWGGDIAFSANIYIKGTPDDLFIFKCSGNVITGSGASVVLVADGNGGGGAPLASNIVWQVAGHLDAGTTSHLEGIFLIKTFAAFKTGSSLNGRILAQTAVTLDSVTVVAP
mmetsp:Transcript_9357/g.16187  ORF Transcript_9357/g.16187 Transcript_9357/m.16187 type:complete len:260 (-) Transcript_9357:287-1066(-)